MFPLLGLLNRTVFWELVKVFVLSLTGLTGLFLMGLVVQQASQMGLSLAQTLAAIPLMVPITLPFTIPATTLFASCVVYGRVANDNEAVAVKAAGVDLLTVLRPALVLGVGAAAATTYLNVSVIPVCQQKLQAQLLDDPEEVLYNFLRKDRCLRDPNFPYVVYVRDVQGRRLIDVVVKKRRAPAKPGGPPAVGYDLVARAREARLVVDIDRGKLAIDPDRWVLAGGTSRAESAGNRPLEIDLPDKFTGKELKARATSLEWGELAGRVADLRAKRAEYEGKRADARRLAAEAADPTARKQLADQDPHFAAHIKEVDRQVRVVEYEYHVRPALAVGCLCFAVVGCPVGLWANRADYLSTFVTCFLPAVFAYYPLLLAGGGLAKDGKVPMAVGVWAADIVMGLAAVGLTFKLVKR